MNQRIDRCAVALANQIDLPVSAVPSSDALSNIGYSLRFESQTELPVYWLDEETANKDSDLGYLRTHGESRIVASDYIKPATAKRLRQEEIQYVDQLGNAFIFSGVYRIVIIGHQRRKERSTKKASQRTGKAFMTSGLKVQFALFNTPSLVNSSLRDIGSTVGVSPATVSDVLKDLQAHDMIYTNQLGKAFDAKKEHLDRWADAYPYQVREKQFIGQFTTDLPNWWERLSEGNGYQVSGEAGAYMMFQYMTPQDGIIYTSQNEYTRLIKDLRLRKIKPGEIPSTTITLYEPFWSHSKGGVAPDLIVYSDLKSTQEPRNIEIADMIYQKLQSQGDL